MIHSIYLNNYKGFSNTFIPFGDVNFLVGDNSTGKTSVINIIKMLESPSYWSFFDLFVDSDEVIPFKEIVNHYSHDQSYFTIGVDTEWDDVNERVYFSISYKEGVNNKLPELDSYRFTVDNVSVLIKKEKEVFAIYTKEKQIISFEKWIKDNERYRRRKDLDFLLDEDLRTPFIVTINFVINHIRKVKDPYTATIKIPTTGNESIAPIRASARKYYHSEEGSFSEEGSHVPHMIKSIFEQEKVLKNAILKVLRRFGKDSGLFDDIKIEKYGNKEYAPFSINIIYNNIPVNLSQVGFGVNQILPLLLESLYRHDYILTYQQPEVHLHPKAQSAFGNVIYYSALTRNNTFFVETHSDYLINRFRYLMHENKDEDEKVSNVRILFFERTCDGIKVYPIVLNENGQYPENMPESYGDFFVDEEINMLSV